MKKNICLLLSFVCLACFVGCKPSYLRNAPDVKKLSSVDAMIMSEDGIAYDYELDDNSAFKVAKCIYDNDSLSSFIAYNFQYPYDQIGDYVEFSCSMSFDINEKGLVSKIHGVSINDWDKKLSIAKRKQIIPELKKEAIRILQQLKFKSQSMIYNPNTGKWTVDTRPMNLDFNITPYPAEKINDKNLIIHYLSLSHAVKSYAEGINGDKPARYVLQQKFLAMTSDKEKENFILHGNNSFLRYLSFEYFVEKKSPKCITFITKSLNDTTMIGSGGGCVSSIQMVSDAMIHRFYRDGRFCSLKDSLMLDSLIFFSHKVKDLDYKYYLMDRLEPTPERYNRARELYNKDKFYHALALIARYRNPQDKPFFFEALQYYIDERERIRNTLTDLDNIMTRSEYKYDSWGDLSLHHYNYTLNSSRDIEAYDAVTFYWRDKDFIPYLKRIDAYHL